MGNHKGRSKGCINCVKRRIKCDKTEPTCLRCSKGKITCSGYRDCFVNNRQKKPRNRDRDAVESQLESKSPRAAHSEESPAIVEEISPTFPPMPGDQALQICRSLSLLPWKNDLMMSYLITKVRAGPMNALCQSVAAFNGSESAQRTTTKQCLLALATGLYGTGHSQGSLILDGRQLYGKALSMVTEMVRNPQGLSLAEAMASVYALSLFEPISPTRNNHNSWLHHIFGLEQLFEIHGPFLKAPDPLFLALLESTRLIMIVAALHNRRPSLLAKPEWSAAASQSPHGDPALFEVACTLDALAQLTTLYPERDKLVSSPQLSALEIMDSPSTTRSLLDQSVDLLANIQCRRIRWLKAHPLSECSTSTGADPSPTYPFKDTLHFNNVHAALSCILHHTTVILVHRFATSVYQLVLSRERNALKENCLAAGHVLSSVEQILKSFAYYIKSTQSTPSSGSASFLLPLRVAYSALDESSLPQHVSWKLWLLNIFSMGADKIQPWSSNKELFNVTKTDIRCGSEV